MLPTLDVRIFVSLDCVSPDIYLRIQHFGVGSIPWSPLGRGYLCRPWAQEVTSVRSETDPHLGLMSGKDTAEQVSRRVNEA